MKSKGFLGDWKSYTLRDKILLSSSITPLIVFVGSFFLMLLHIFTEGNHNISKLLHAESCGELVFKGYDFNVKGSDKDFCSVDLIYSIHPALILLSTISIGIYAFFSIKSDEEVSNIFLSKTSSIESSKSVLLMLQYVYTLSIIFLILFFSFFWMVGDGFYEYTIADEYNDYEIETSCYHHDPLTLICETGTYSWDFYGYAFKPDKVTVNPLSYLFLPNVLATVIFAYKSRNNYIKESLRDEWDNLEIKTHDSFEEYYAVNAYFVRKRGIEDVIETGTKSKSGESSPIVQKHVFLLITIVGGMFGLDKAYKGDYALAVLKLLTLGGLWIWQIYDIYVAAGEAGSSWSLDSDSSLTTEKHVILITAIVGGHIGLDRAYKGDGVTGVFKLLTLGGLGIWWLVDVYVAAKEAGKSW